VQAHLQVYHATGTRERCKCKESVR
jgi:hypothetical protein